MKLTSRLLKKLVISEIRRINEGPEGDATANVGADIRGSAGSERAGEKLEKNKAVQDSLRSINSKAALADFLQITIKSAAENGGLKQEDAVGALKMVLSKISTAK